MNAVASVAGLKNPFPGLRPFEASESRLFFGRDRQSDELVRRLARTRFLAVVGTSGSGKSSLVRAGLLPSLHRGYLANSTSRWRVAMLRPGTDPIGELAAALDSALGPEPGRIDILRRSSLGLVDTARGLAHNENLLVVVDQFEEIIRYRREIDREDAADFVRLLLASARQDEIPVIYVVLTLRSDFLGDCAEFRDLPEALNAGQYLVPRMTRDERREAIEGPIVASGADIAPELLQRVLNDVGDDPDQLPILQHALMRTWSRWEEKGAAGPIALEHYNGVGGMTQALDIHAEDAFAALSEERRRIARKIFQRLTEKGAAGKETRRPTSLRELCGVAAASQSEVIAVIDHFRTGGTTFLVPGEGMTLRAGSMIDISHESLIRLWTRLRNWAETEAESARAYRRLADAARDYYGPVRATDLWRGLQLADTLNKSRLDGWNENWAARYDEGFPTAMRFLEASRRRRMILRLLGAVAVLFLIATALAFAGLWKSAEAAKRQAQTESKRASDSADMAKTERERAEDNEIRARENERIAKENEKKALLQEEEASRERTTAESREIAATAISRLQSDSVLGLLLAKQAAAHAPTAQAEDALRQALLQPYAFGTIDTGKSVVAFSPDGRWVAAADQTRLRLWQPETSQPTEVTLQWPATRLEFSPDGRVLFARNEQGNEDAFSVAGQSSLTLPQGGDKFSRGVAVNSDGSLLLQLTGRQVKRSGRGVPPVGYEYDPVARVVVSATGELLHTLTHDGPVSHALFSPDGKYVLTASRGGNGRIWHGQEYKNLGQFQWVNVQFSPNSRWLAATDGFRDFAVWETDSGTKFELPAPAPGAVRSIQFSPDGRYVLLQTGTNVPMLWETGSKTPARDLTGHTAAVKTAVFSPDGDRLVTSAPDGVRLWKLTGYSNTARELVPAEVNPADAAFSSDGRFIVAACGDRTARIFETLSGTTVSVLPHRSPVQAARFTPDGRVVATLDQSGSLRSWEMGMWRTLDALPVPAGIVFGPVFDAQGKAVALIDRAGLHQSWQWNRTIVERAGPSGAKSAQVSANGLLAATVREDSTARIWDVAAGKELAELRGPSRYLEVTAFSPDGRLVLTIDQSNLCTVWDASTGARIHSWQVLKNDRARKAVFSADSRFVVAAGQGIAAVWEARTGTSKALISHHRVHGGAPIESVDISPDGRFIVTADPYSAVLWDTTRAIGDNKEVANPTELRQGLQAGQERPVRSAAFSPDGRFVVIAAREGVRIRNVQTQETRSVLRPDCPFPEMAVFSPDGQSVLTACREGNVTLWTDTGPRREWKGMKLSPHKGLVTSVTFSRDGKRVSTAGRDRTVKISESANGALVGEFISPEGADLTSAAFVAGTSRVLISAVNGATRVWDPDQRKVVATMHGSVSAANASSHLIVTAGRDDTAILWETRTGRTIGELRGITGAVSASAFSPDATLFITGSADGTVRAWQVGTARLLWQDRGNKRVNSLSFSANGKLVVAAVGSQYEEKEGIARIFEAGTGKVLADLRGHTGAVVRAEFSRDGRIAVTGGREGVARIWEIGSNRPPRELPHGSEIKTMALSPDGSLVATGSGDLIRIWKTATAKLFSDLQDRNQTFESVQFSPDSKYVVTAGGGTARVWVAATGLPIADMSGHAGPVKEAAFSPDGKLVVTRSEDRYVRVFECSVCGSLADLTKLAQIRLQTLKRELTPEERERYLPASRKSAITKSPGAASAAR